tara:strand:+ start:368 stop:547 length:180 start_codon:yes stop_codon:yes gene_type:complete
MPKESKPWGIWVLSSETWMMDSPRKKSRFRLRREAASEAESFNKAWKGRKPDYEARRIP